MNKITATGRIAADAEVRFTPSGDPIASFRLASDVGFGDKKTTNWFSCQVWGKRGEALAPHLVKGTQVTVFGTLTLRPWTDKSGNEKISPDVRVDEIELQGGKKDGAQPSDQQQPQRNSQGAQRATFDDMDDDVPFQNPYAGRFALVV